MSTHTIYHFQYKKKITLNYPKSAAIGFFLRDPKNEFKTALINEPSVFELLKVYCTCMVYESEAPYLDLHCLTSILRILYMK